MGQRPADDRDPERRLGDIPATAMLPAPARYGDVVDRPSPTQRVDDHGTVQVDPDEFESFDDHDSTTVVDAGAPD